MGVQLITSPDLDAFVGGVGLGVSALLLVLGIFGALAVARRILGA